MKATKKPVEIDAVQWFTDGDHDSVGLWRYPPVDPDTGEVTAGVEGIFMGQMPHSEVPKKFRRESCPTPMFEHGYIETLEGDHIVCPGDWIITGIAGEHYPCKPDIFARTYDYEAEDRSIRPLRKEDRAEEDTEPWRFPSIVDATITDEKITVDSIQVKGFHIADMTTCETCGAIKPINAKCPSGCFDYNSYKFVNEGLVVEVPASQPDVVTIATPSLKVSTDKDGYITVQPIYEEKIEMSVDEHGNKIVYMRLDDLKRVYEAAQKTWAIQGADEYHGPSNRIRRILDGER